MNGPFLIGLTGSVGMGKSTAAEMFRELGVPVWDADAAVHRLYSAGGAGVAAIAALHPSAIVDGAVDRSVLSEWIAADETALGRIEDAIHPLVARDRADFIASATSAVVLLDIPLLYETGSDNEMDLVVVVSARPEVHRARVLSRPGMTEARFEAIVARQMPDAVKRARADVVLPSETLGDTRRHVARLMDELKSEVRDA